MLAEKLLGIPVGQAHDDEVAYSLLSHTAVLNLASQETFPASCFICTDITFTSCSASLSFR